MHLGFTNIQNLTGSDGDGFITPTVKASSNGQDISMTFNRKAVGLGATLPFQFSFDTTDVASLNGAIWEINIPGLSNQDDFTDFTVKVITPSYFGKPTYMKPNVNTDGNLTFTKDQLGESGISLAFGDKQVYSFNLDYHLENTQIFPIQTEIALPPETSYQHVEIDDITPRPQNVTQDADGNWLAQYHLLPSQKVTIKVKGKAYISLHPTTHVLTLAEQALYTKPTQYWQTNNDKIQELAHQLKTPEAIYQYVVKTLHYDFSRISDNQKRLGAVGVLNQPDQAVCLEFTDLFIALARAAGIPARELDGYAYTQNTVERPLSLQKEILHAWPEYYDSANKSWVMVDPTWENTTGGVDYFHTFDFDHLTLVIKGASSTYPIPAGGYKLPGQEAEKDVNVSFSPDSLAPDPLLQMTLNFPQEVTAGLPINGSILLKNTGSVVFSAQTLLAQSSLAKITSQTPDIPPFGNVSVPLNMGKTAFLTNTTDVIKIQLAGKTVTKSVRIAAFSFIVFAILGGVLVGLFIIIISIIARRSRRISIPR